MDDTSDPLEEKIQSAIADQQPVRLTQLDYMPGSIKNRHIGEGVNALRSNNADVDVSASATPSANQVLTATTPTTAIWKTGVSALLDATGSVDTSAATAPTSGQVLTATGASTATWQTPTTSTPLASKIITATRLMTASGGDVSYTGVGFIPTSMHIQAHIEATQFFSVGFADSSKVTGEVGRRNDSNFYGDSNAIYIDTAAGASQVAIIKTWDADGFTLTWTKNGSPGANTVNLIFLCYK